MNLTFVLVNAKRPLQREEIRKMVPGYPDSQIAFERMFERDKEELRNAGVEVVTRPVDEFFEDSLGYLIKSAPKNLEVSFSLEERAILGLAEAAWRDPSLRSLARTGAIAAESVRLEHYEPEVEPWAGVMVGSIGTLTSKVLPIVAALHTGRQITFEYQGSKDSSPRARLIEPWGLFRVSGVWYLIGYDTQVKGQRTFRLSRITSIPQVETQARSHPMPDEGDLSQLVQLPEEYPNWGQIEVDGLAPKDVQSLWRRQLRDIHPTETGFAGVVGYLDPTDYARYLLRFSPYIRVIEPPELAKALSQAASEVLARIV